MDSATFLEWLVKNGARVAQGEAIANVETAKATVEVVAPVAGFVIRGEAKRGDEIPLGSVLARIATAEPSVGRAESAVPVQPRRVAENAAPTASSAPLATVRATPSARRLAHDKGVDLSLVKPAGESILDSDVLLYLSGSATGAAADNTCASDGYRRSMARAMAESATIPQFDVAMDCDGEALLAEHRRLADAGLSTSLNDLVLWHVARVLAKHPRICMFWGSAAPKYAAAVNIAVAMATPHGLVAPVIHAADARSLEELSAEIQRLKLLAFEQRLRVEDVSGASFSVSNLGGLGVDDFTALVSAGQGAILAVSSFKPGPVSTPGGGTKWRARARFRVSADHRVMTGAEVADFLRDLCTSIEGR